MQNPNYNHHEHAYTHETTIACEGSGTGHPRVYLKINPNTMQTICPYCDKIFEFQGDADSLNHH